MRNEYKMVCETPCYVDEDNVSRDNPYRLTVAAKEDGTVWLLAEGNGCGNDMELVEGFEGIADLSADVLRDNARELREAGYEDEADWVEERAKECDNAPKTWYAIQTRTSGEWDGDGSYDLNEAKKMLVKAWEEWNDDEDECADNEPQIAVVTEYKDPCRNYCDKVIRYDAETGTFEEV